MPYSRMPTSSKTSNASLRTGPRHTTSTFISASEKERSHGESHSWKRRMTRSESSTGLLLELSLRAGHRRRRVGAHQQREVLGEHAAAGAGHDDARHRSE